MDTPLPLRRARVEDAAAIRALSRAAYGKWVPLIGREPKPMTADYGKAVREHDSLLPALLPVGDGLLVAKKVWTPGA